MPKNKFAINRKQAVELYFDAFPELDRPEVTVASHNTKSGVFIAAYEHDELFDRVLVRWDHKIFRYFQQVFPEVL